MSRFSCDRQHKISVHPLYDLCMFQIAKEFSTLETDLTCLPYTLINDLYDNRKKYQLDNSVLTSKMFLNPGTNNLVVRNFIGRCDPDSAYKLIPFGIQPLISPLSAEEMCKISQICTNVTTLVLSSTNWIGVNAQIKLLKNFPRVEKLTLPNKCTDDTFRTIATHCPELRLLHSGFSSEITDEAINILCLNKLKIDYLDIRGTSVTFKACLHALNTLRELKVFKNDFWNDIMESFKSKMKSTENICVKSYNIKSLDHNIKVNEYFEVIFNLFPKIQNLKLNQHVDLFLADSSSFCSKLKKLTWYTNNFKPDLVDLVFIGQVFSNLKYLCLHGDGRYTNRTYVQYFETTPNLTLFRHLLELHLCRFQGEDGIRMLLANCHGLQKLHIDGCDDFSDDLLKDLIKLNPLNHLKVLHVFLLRSISTESLLRFLEINSLEEVHITRCRLVDFDLLKYYLRDTDFHLKYY